jgi:hypothetical protein
MVNMSCGDYLHAIKNTLWLWLHSICYNKEEVSTNSCPYLSNVTPQPYQYIRMMRGQVIIPHFTYVHCAINIYYTYYTVQASKWILKLCTKDFGLVSWKLKVFQMRRGTSLWAMFGIIADNNGNECDYVACIKCNHVLSYKKGKSGTSNMQTHKCSVPTKQPLLTK